MRTEICVAGAGGQGILLFGTVLTHAAAVESKSAVCLPSYGAEARGGEVKCFVIVSDTNVKSPFPERFEHLVFFSAKAFTRFEAHLLAGTTVFHDAGRAPSAKLPDGLTAVPVPLGDLVREIDPRCANMAMLGVFLQASGILSPSSVEPALRDVAKGRGDAFIGPNLEAVEAGRRWAADNAKLV